MRSNVQKSAQMGARGNSRTGGFLRVHRDCSAVFFPNVLKNSIFLFVTSRSTPVLLVLVGGIVPAGGSKRRSKTPTACELLYSHKETLIFNRFLTGASYGSDPYKLKAIAAGGSPGVTCFLSSNRCNNMNDRRISCRMQRSCSISRRYRFYPY